jgi:hypothetical protein
VVTFDPRLGRPEAPNGAARYLALKFNHLVGQSRSMKSLALKTDTASREAILEQLERILDSSLFCASERSSTLIRFLVEQALNSDTARLKEYTIGVEGLGKGPSFDPRTDPIVRAEASRLRSRLEKYYATEGNPIPSSSSWRKGITFLNFNPGA